MARLSRVTQRIFGSSAGPTEIAQFGSLAASAPAFSTDPTVIQALANWLGGWFSGVELGNSPAIEDMNAFCYVISYQLAYLLQAGVPEWISTTTYFIGDIAQDGSGNLYRSLTDNNTGNALSSTANWAPPKGSIKTKTTNYTILSTDGLIKVDSSGGSFNLTLPAASNNIGMEVKVKKFDSSGNPVTLLPTGSDSIDGEVSQLLQGAMEGVTLKSDGISNWYVF